MKSYFGNQKTGFTLTEVLVAVLIVAVLVAMAVPMYEKTVEKSRRAEVSVALKRMSESKLRTMNNMEIDTFAKSPQSFTHAQMDGTFQNTADFTYSLYPSATYPNAVCAKRARGDYNGTIFLYLGETASEYCTCPQSGTTSICGGYCNKCWRLFCKETKTGACAVYGMDSVSTSVSCDTSVF